MSDWKAKFLGYLGWTPAKPGVTFLDHTGADVWNKTKAADPTLRTALEQLENDRNHYVTVQTEGPWPNQLKWKGALGQTTYVASKQGTLDGSQIFLRQSDMPPDNPAFPAMVLAHEAGHVLDRMANSDDVSTWSVTPDHGPNSICTKLTSVAEQALNITPECRDDFSANVCSPEHPLWEAPLEPNPP
jgi:hypothetical protein